MELRQVEYFLAVAEHDGIGGAATALGVAQPTVSQALRALERELGVQLFHRIGRGMVLSAAGRTLVGPARQIVRDVASVDDLLSAVGDDLSGRLEILSSSFVAGERLIELIAHFRARHPGVTVRVGDLRDETRAAAVIEEGQCEFVVSHLPFVGDHPQPSSPQTTGAQAADPEITNLETIVLGEQEYWLVAPPGTELPDQPVTVGELPRIPWVLIPRGASMAEEIEIAIREAGVRLPVAVVSEHRETRLPLVLAGVGATLIERSIAEAAADRAVVRPVEPRFVRPYGAIFDPGTLSPIGHAFLDLLRAETASAPTRSNTAAKA